MVYAFLFKIILVFVTSFVFGLERQRAHKQVGFGTFTFVAIGACSFAIVALELFPENSAAILGATMTGVGFLGAGALIKNNDKIYGFTTAASIWVFAIYGILIGLGEYPIGGILYLVIWFVVIGDRYLEKRGIGSYKTRLVIVTNKLVCEDDIRNFLLKVGVKNTNLKQLYKIPTNVFVSVIIYTYG